MKRFREIHGTLHQRIVHEPSILLTEDERKRLREYVRPRFRSIFRVRIEKIKRPPRKDRRYHGTVAWSPWGDNGPSIPVKLDLGATEAAICKAVDTLFSSRWKPARELPAIIEDARRGMKARVAEHFSKGADYGKWFEYLYFLEAADLKAALIRHPAEKGRFLKRFPEWTVGDISFPSWDGRNYVRLRDETIYRVTVALFVAEGVEVEYGAVKAAHVDWKKSL